MKGIHKAACAALAALAAALPLAACAEAQRPDIAVYVSRGAMERETALRLVALASQAYPQAAWSASFEEDTGLSLRDLVLSDAAPQIALCRPQEALPWAKEGLLMPLEERAGDLSRMQPEVVEACVWAESLYLAPLTAKTRRMAVNRELLAAAGLEYLLDARAHPVWTPTELYQAIDEATVSGCPALELWPPEAEDAAWIEAFLQCLYGGRLLGADGAVLADGEAVVSALVWLRDLAQSGAVGSVQERETALCHFLDGQTLLFMDWTDADARRAREIEALDVCELPYPAADCVRVRVFEPVGAAVFAGRDAQAVSLALGAVTLFESDARAQRLLGERGVWEDGAFFIADLGAAPGGATLRGLLLDAVRGALAGEKSPGEALREAAAVARGILRE